MEEDKVLGGLPGGQTKSQLPMMLTARDLRERARQAGANSYELRLEEARRALGEEAYSKITSFGAEVRIAHFQNIITKVREAEERGDEAALQLLDETIEEETAADIDGFALRVWTQEVNEFALYWQGRGEYGDHIAGAFFRIEESYRTLFARIAALKKAKP